LILDSTSYYYYHQPAKKAKLSSRLSIIIEQQAKTSGEEGE
jgi:hypothetical protein